MSSYLTVNRFGYTWKNKEKFPRVTSIKGVVGAGEALINWAAGCVHAEVQEIVQEYRANKISEVELCIRLQDESLAKAHTRQRDKKANYGLDFHTIAERLSKGHTNALEGFEGTHLAVCEKFLEWCEEYQPVFGHTEVCVISRTHKYAGTCDQLGMKIGDRKFIVDYKTSKAAYKEFALQMAAYRYADFIASPDGNEYPIPEVDGCAILLVSEAGCQLQELEAGPEQFEAFLACKRIYDWQKSQPNPEPVLAPSRVHAVFA